MMYRLQPILPLTLLATLFGWAAAFANAPSSASKQPSEKPRPNLLFILADDLGWSDTSIYGSTFHQTPNIDRLARRGIRFMNAYAANPLCSPTRASILTGRYPERVGITTPACHLPQAVLEAKLSPKGRPHQKAITPRSATRLNTTHPTLAKTLQQAGYATGHFGKWHLGHEPYSAREHGFEIDVPHWPGPGPAGSYLAPWKFPAGLEFTGREGEHIEDRMANEALAFLRKNKDRPFYLNYWAFSVHGPWQAKEELVRRYNSKVDPDAPQRSPIYAAMVQSLDEAVGRLLDTLDELGLTENTIVVFFSDNGGVHWLDERMKKRDGLEAPPTSSAPLRGGKATIYEGGTRVPCAVIWPGHTRSDTTTDALLSSVDFYPTIIEMLGLERADDQNFDGVSQVRSILGQSPVRDTAYCFFPHYIPVNGNLPGAWVRQGRYKLIRFFCDNPDQTDRFELYDLEKDIGESDNLAPTMPEKVAELDRLLARHLEKVQHLIPRPNPDYDSQAAPTQR